MTASNKLIVIKAEQTAERDEIWMKDYFDWVTRGIEEVAMSQVIKHRIVRVIP
jgi:hypothetical protein